MLQDKTDREHYDVGIVGYWYATNYGSVLTYYALYKAIEKMGYSTVLLDRPDKHLDGEPQSVFSRDFMNRHVNISESYSCYEQDRFDKLCDRFVVGSDQVWTPHAITNVGYRFFLDFVSPCKIKVAYAPSFGNDSFFADDEIKRNVSLLLSRFDAVSVRENVAVDVCKREFGRDADEMIDPIFLHSQEFYERLSDLSKIDTSEPYVLSYILDPDENKRAMLVKSRDEKSMKLVNLLDGRYNTFEKNNERLNLPNTHGDISEEDWVKLFKDAEFVITDSHHGFAMAVIFNKPVICIMNKERGAARFTSLLGWLGMFDRLVDSNENLEGKEYLFGKYDYSEVNRIVKKRRKESLKWLSHALAGREMRQGYLSNGFRRIKRLCGGRSIINGDKRCSKA